MLEVPASQLHAMTDRDPSREAGEGDDAPRPSRDERVPPVRSAPAGRPASPDLTDEQEIVERAKSGDIKAFECLIQWSSSRVLGFLVRWLQDRALAEDVFQEATTRAFLHIGSLRRGERFRPWFFRIAVNRAKTHARKRATLEARETGIVEEGTEDEATRSPWLRREAAALVEHALKTLSPTDRQILLLRFGEELSLREIAEVLGSSELVIKMRVFRARARFRRAVRCAEEE